MKKSIWIYPIAFVVLLFSACGKKVALSGESLAYAGKWVAPNGSVIEILADGTGTFNEVFAYQKDKSQITNTNIVSNGVVEFKKKSVNFIVSNKGMIIENLTRPLYITNGIYNNAEFGFSLNVDTNGIVLKRNALNVELVNGKASFTNKSISIRALGIGVDFIVNKPPTPDASSTVMILKGIEYTKTSK